VDRDYLLIPWQALENGFLTSTIVRYYDSPPVQAPQKTSTDLNVRIRLAIGSQTTGYMIYYDTAKENFDLRAVV
jgi:hypothetical protein